MSKSQLPQPRIGSAVSKDDHTNILEAIQSHLQAVLANPEDVCTGMALLRMLDGVANFGLHRSGLSADAQLDIRQQVLSEVWPRLLERRDADDLAQYVVQQVRYVGKRRIIDEYRRQGRKKEVPLPDVVQPEKSASIAEAIEHVCVRYPKSGMGDIALALASGQSIGEIAQALGVAENSVRVMISRFCKRRGSVNE